MEQYTDVRFVDRENITVATDTHVIQASERFGTYRCAYTYVVVE